MGTRASIGSAISGTTAGANEIVQSIGAKGGYDTEINTFLLKGVHVYQKGSIAMSLKLVRHENDQLHASDTDTGRWNNYSNEITSNVLNPVLITWSAQPSTVNGPELASAIIGGSVGDYAHIMFEKPVEILMRKILGDPSQCIGLRIAEIGAYDLAVTWIFEMTRAI